MTTMTLASCGIDEGNLPERLGVTLSLLLTSVAYKFAAAQVPN